MPPTIEDLIPLYLADHISLGSAIQLALQHPKPALLLPTLKESKSLPRSTDTDPTTPTPDLPSPSQERLLHLVRGVEAWTRPRDSGIALDDLINEPRTRSDRTNENDSVSDEYDAVHAIVTDSVREFSADSVRIRGEQRDIDVHIPSTSGSGSRSGSVSMSVPASSSGSTSGLGTGPATGRRRNSAVEKHIYNLISFLAFLTKKKLLLHRGTGERIAVEMISETLDRPQTYSCSPSPTQRHSRRRSYSRFYSSASANAITGMNMNYSQTVQKPRYSSWFGFGSVADSDEIGVTAVSLWLIIMGEELYQRAQREEAKADAKAGPGSGSGSGVGVEVGSGPGPDSADLWAQLSLVVLCEWETWMSRLQFLSLREDLGIAAREQAAEAAAVMRRVY